MQNSFINEYENYIGDVWPGEQLPSKESTQWNFQSMIEFWVGVLAKRPDLHGCWFLRFIFERFF